VQANGYSFLTNAASPQAFPGAQPKPGIIEFFIYSSTNYGLRTQGLKGVLGLQGSGLKMQGSRAPGLQDEIVRAPGLHIICFWAPGSTMVYNLEI